MTPIDTDVLIVGAGPVGLFGAYYAGVRGLRTAVVDSLAQPGGQVSAMYPEKQILDIAGLPAITGRSLIEGLMAQCAPYRPRFLLGQEARTLERLPAGHGPHRFAVTTATGSRVTTGAVVVTGGIGTFAPRPLPAGESHLGRGLAYFVPDPADYAGHEVVVVGGGDSALDWALTLLPLASGVTLVHRRASFRGHRSTVDRVLTSPVTVLTGAEVTATHGDGRLEAVEVRVSGDPGTRILPCTRLVAALGFTADPGPLRGWGLDLHDNRHIVVDSAMRTNLPGVFAAGDITHYDGKVRLIATGFGEVATAVNNAAVHLDPGTQLFPGHSTDASGAPLAEPAAV